MGYKFPKEYYTIANVEGVTDEVVNAYRSAIRHEMYTERKERQVTAFSYGYVKDVAYLSPCYQDDFYPDEIKIENNELDFAMQKLLMTNKLWYDAIRDYYFKYGGISRDELADKYGISPQELGRRINCGVMFLRKIMKE